MSTLFPTPTSLGLPAKFAAWGPGQRKAFDLTFRALTSGKRFTVLSAPTGYGKSIVYMSVRKALATLTLSDQLDDDRPDRYRAAIITASKGLQDQNESNFGQAAGWDGWDVRGQSNYQCMDYANVKCDIGKHFCRAGIRCAYQQAYRNACDSDLPMTNYAYWLAVAKSSMIGLGERRNLKNVQDAHPFDLLVLDEAHEAESFLANSLHIEIKPDELVGNGGLLGWTQWPVNLDPDLTNTWDNLSWSTWASNLSMHVISIQDKLTETLITAKQNRSVGNLPSSFFTKLYRVNQLMEDLDALSANVEQDGGRVVETEERTGAHKPYHVITSDVVSPARYAERYLFRKIPRVLLASATITPANVKALGIPEDQMTFIDLPAIFDMRRAPIWAVAGARMNYHTPEDDVRDEDGGVTPGRKSWLRAIDRIIAKYPSSKGVIHTSSYNLQRYILTNTTHGHRVLGNDKSVDTAAKIEQFKASSDPLVFVSPSITTGYDFPDDECRFVIIAKLPLQQVKSKIIKARLARNPSYIDCQVAQELVQAAGRGMRGAKDWCATYIVDEQIKWFYSKNRHLFPRWFVVANTDDILLLTPQDFAPRP